MSPKRTRTIGCIQLLVCATLALGIGAQGGSKVCGQDAGRFKYFSYGSNLLTERILVNNPTATYCHLSELKHYVLTYTLPASAPVIGIWNSSVASIIPSSEDNAHVWGTVWEIDRSQIKHLDRQESMYDAVEVEVETEFGATEVCRTYIMHNTQGYVAPGRYYRKVILMGARQHNLPEDYIQFLESFKDTGFQEEPSEYLKVKAELAETAGDSVIEE